MNCVCVCAPFFCPSERLSVKNFHHFWYCSNFSLSAKIYQTMRHTCNRNSNQFPFDTMQMHFLLKNTAPKQCKLSVNCSTPNSYAHSNPMQIKCNVSVCRRTNGWNDNVKIEAIASMVVGAYKENNVPKRIWHVRNCITEENWLK